MSGDTFNCGEYRPGKKPFVSGGKGGGNGPGTGGPTWITKTKKHGPPGLIYDSGGPGGPVPAPPSPAVPWWKCEEEEVIKCDTGYHTIKEGIIRKCHMCTLKEMQDDLLLPKHIRKCKYSKKSECETNCVDTKPECGPITIPGGRIAPPLPPSVPPAPPGGGDPLDPQSFCHALVNEPIRCHVGEQTISEGYRRKCIPCEKTHTGCIPLSVCKIKCVDVRPTCLKTDSGPDSEPIRGGKKKTYICKDFTNEPIFCGGDETTLEAGVKRGCVECDQDGPGCNDLSVCKHKCISSKPSCVKTGPGTGKDIRSPKTGPEAGKRTSDSSDPESFCHALVNEPIRCHVGEKTIREGYRRKCIPCERTHTGCIPLSACKIKCVDVKPTCLKTDLGTTRELRNDFRIISELTVESRKLSGIGNRLVKEPEKVDLYEEMLKSLENDPNAERGNSIYDPKFNLFLTPNPFLESLPLESNNKYLDIFKDEVSPHIYWCLYSLSPSSSWDESAYANLTIKDIANSIDPILLNSLASIKYVGGIPISLEDMLEVIKYLLFSNRLDEFDPGYYIELADEHSSHYKVQYEGTNADSKVKTQAALGLIASDADSPDPEEAPDGFRPYLRKLKYLNEDLGVGMPVLGCEGATSGADLYNEGLQVVRLKNSNNANEQVSSMIELAEGGGYYLSASICDNSDVSSAVAVDASSNLSIALNVPPEVRANSLSIVEEDDSIKFTASVSYVNSEFGDDYDLTSELSPMYFILDLSTVGEKANANPIVTDTTGTYTMVTSVDTINNHARSNGYNVRVLNVDYNDPFLVYASGTSSIDMTSKDISFTNFMVKKGGPREDKVILRRPPFAVILNPGKGSKHNPLAGESELESWEGSVTRNIYFVPDIDMAEDGTLDTVLEKYFTGVEDGTYRIGLMEPTDTNSAGFRYETSSAKFQNTYYSDGSESSTMPTRTRSGVATLVRKVDTLVSKYEVPTGKITWFDIWKRFDATEFYNIQNVSVSAGFTEWLIGGGRGVKITKVLSRSPLVITGLGTDKDASIDDPIYITNYDRGYDSSVDPPIQE